MKEFHEKTCLVLLEKLCFLAQDSPKHLSLQVAVHAAHGAVIDPISHELEHCTGDRQRRRVKGQRVLRGQSRSLHFRQQPQLPPPTFATPPHHLFSAFHLQPPDLAMVRIHMRVMFRVKAAAASSWRIQSVRRPVKKGMAISPAMGQERCVSHRYQV